MKLPPLILASASPRRAELLKQLGAPFQIVPSSATELHAEDFTVSELSQMNAYRKARVVAKEFPDSLVIGMDTLVALGTRLFGKPSSRADAQQMLLALEGKTHQVVTGVCLIHLREHRQKVFADLTDVTFRSLTIGQIQDYHARINPLDKAGAYAIQEHGDMIVEKISGSFSNVVGLPLDRLQREIQAFEIVISPR